MISPLTAAEQALAARARAAGRLAAARMGSEPAPGDAAAEEAAARHALAALSEEGITRHAVAGAAGRIGVRDLCVIREELAAASGLADVMFAMQGLGSLAIALDGTDEARGRWLPGIAAGTIAAGIAMTEPEAGSDLGAIATTAVPEDDGYRIDGVKTFISNAGVAGVYTLFARTGGGRSPREGITAFALDAATPGLRVRERLAVAAPHPIGTLELTGCRVPAASRLGAEGGGHDLALRVLDHFRPTVGAAAVGMARRALEESIGRARERRQFGRPIAEFQAIRFKLADMATWLEAARLLVLRAATMVDDRAAAGRRADPAMRCASAMAKLYATEAAQRIIDEAVQIHGGLGVTRGQVVERLYREVRALRIYEGTSEIQRSIVAHALLRDGRG